MDIYKGFNLNYKHRRLLLLTKKSLESTSNTLVCLNLLNLATNYPRYTREATELGTIFENFTRFSNRFHPNATLKELLNYKLIWIDSLTSYLNIVHKQATKVLKEIK